MNMAVKALKDFNIGEATRLELEKQMKIATGELTEKEIAQQEAIGYLTQQLALGNITTEEYLQYMKDLASGARDANELIKAVGENIEKLPDSKDIYITVHYNEKHKGGGQVSEPGGDTDVNVPEEPYVPGPKPGGQHGLNMIVPPGYNHDNYYFRASSGEQVVVLPQGRKLGGDTYILNIHTNGRSERIADDFK